MSLPAAVAPDHRPSARVPRDLGPLAWVMDELRQTLQEAVTGVAHFVEDNEAARAGDLAEVDATPLRVLRQQVHQAAGALEMVELQAAGRTLQALEALLQRLVQKPATATPALAQAVAQGARALLDYLDRQMRERPVHELALFPVYRTWQQMAGVAWVHPAELWTAALDATAVAPPGRAWPPGAQVRAHLERLVLLVVKDQNPQAAAQMAQLCAGLARGARDAPDGAVCQFWLAAAACGEALACGLLPAGVHLKRAVSRLLLQYAALAQGTSQGLEAHARELLLLVARADPGDAEVARCPHLMVLRQAHGFVGAAVPDWELEVLGRYDPLQLHELRESVRQAQLAWSLLTEAAQAQEKGTTEATTALRRLSQALDALVGDGHGLAGAWAQVAAALPPSAALALEVSSSLLFLEAQADDYDPLDTELPLRLTQLAQRLQDVLAGRSVPEPQAWMSALYRDLSQKRTLGHVVGQLKGELGQLESALEVFLRRPDPAILQVWPSRLDSLRGVLIMLGLGAAEQALALIRRTVQAWLGTDAVPPDERLLQAQQQLAPNLSVLGWLLYTLERQPALAREGFHFDARQGLLLSRLVPLAGTDEVPTAVPEPPPQEAMSLPDATIPPDAGNGVAGDEPDEDAELLEVFLAEAREVFESVDAAIQALRQRGDSLADLTSLRRAFHTLKGSSRMVGLTAFGESAWAMEQLLNAWLADQKVAGAELLDLCQAAAQALARWAEALAVGQVPTDVSVAVRASADAMRLEGRLLPLGEPTATAAVAAEPEAKVIGHLRIDPELYSVFLEEADAWSQQLCAGLTTGAAVPGHALPAMERLAHQLAGASATVGHQALSQLARALEHALGRWGAQNPPGSDLGESDLEILSQAAEVARQLLHQFAAGFLREAQSELLQAVEALAVPSPALAALPAAVSTDAAAGEVSTAAETVEAVEAGTDHLDVDLFPVFEDEAQDLLLRLGAALRQWHAMPQDGQSRAEVLRCLHTLKGSARLAGALRLGDMLHRLESQALALPDVPVDPASILPLLQALDAIDLRFNALREAFAPTAQDLAPGAVDGMRLEATEDLAAAARLAAATEPTTATLSTAVAVAGTAAPTTVRVRTELLDRLMVQTGDVMTTRNRLEAEVRSLQLSFRDMGVNLDRLRLQLRELELQTETRVQSLQVPQRDAESTFDPLEFDRYTRLQELARLLAESVNDVATVQRSFKRAVDGAEGGLAAQARQTRELQHDLLRTRLVAFEQMAERLHRLVRLTAESLGKQVELQVDGGDIEADRGVLERVLPVLEHLLRNAVVHGIEAPPLRRAKGKPDTGRIVIALAQGGNDLRLSVSDDGAGLDLARIRDRAMQQGVLRPDQPFGDVEALQAIFLPGLSTATEVSEVAGRGIGLDVARNEVLGLGGRIDACRAAEGGLGFSLVVPLTTAVTQVVMVRVGELSFGVPAPWVQVVRRASAAELTAAYVAGQWREAGVLMPFHWAGALLALSPESQDPHAAHARSWPVLVFQSAGQQVAWHVDEVLGHQEVVLKPLGPQLAHLPGLAGAAVLASGAVALIYNPVALSALHGDSARRWVQDQRDAAGQAATQPEPSRRGAQAPLVLVVDDSITVRRVTQRLLKREGYRVALAADGLQALERLREEAPVVVLCDIEMPRMDGFELVRQLRGDARWRTLPVVMITSRTADKHQDHARRMGVDHYLGKPYAEEELLALVSGYARLAAPLE